MKDRQEWGRRKRGGWDVDMEGGEVNRFAKFKKGEREKWVRWSE